MKRSIAYTLIVVLCLGLIGALVVVGRQRQAQALNEQTAAYHRGSAKHASQQAGSGAATAKVKKPVAAQSAAAKAKAAQLRAVGQGQTLNLAVMGDDIAAAKADGGFQYQLRDYLQTTLGYTVDVSGNWATGATIGGTGLWQVTSIAAKQPGLVIVEYGTNEQDQQNRYFAHTNTLQINLTALLNDLRGRLPNAKLVVLTSWRQAADTGADYDTAIRAAATAAGASVVDLSAQWAKASNSATDHWPTKAGQRAIAQAVIKQALVPIYVPEALR
ncbi:SGNH/GDSL hydrolase family protein [Lacticaseibacillus kribbianus]|uniref:SGNH/GDSL hydrolase family protein n=1 Tax=Lacticaseibacillus kribbianus TaxID=2926292 RepID=UPI001CD43BF6|nr:SGNH/GDSL hydrolase family protein [Lacticaseibacillus kribbianus]